MTVTLYRLRGEVKHRDDQGDPRRYPHLWEAIEVHEDRLVGYHTVRVDAESFAMTHPLSCGLIDCVFDARAHRWVSGEEPFPHSIAPVIDGNVAAPTGRYRWDVVPDDPERPIVLTELEGEPDAS